jgi:hypothetical protein
MSYQAKPTFRHRQNAGGVIDSLLRVYCDGRFGKG